MVLQAPLSGRYEVSLLLLPPRPISFTVFFTPFFFLFFFICSSFSQRPRRDAALPLLAVRRHPSHSPDQERPLQEPQHQRAALVPLHTLAAEVQTLSLVKTNTKERSLDHTKSNAAAENSFSCWAQRPRHTTAASHVSRTGGLTTQASHTARCCRVSPVIVITHNLASLGRGAWFGVTPPGEVQRRATHA